MASSYSSDLKLELMATGENAGTWGTKTNNNLNLVQQGVAGYQAIDVASSNVVLAMTDGTVSNARNATLKFTGTLAANRTVTLPDSIEKVFNVIDGTNHAGFTLTFKTASGTGVLLCEGNCYVVYSDGTNVNLGDIVNFVDSRYTFDTNALTIGRNSSKIANTSADLVVNTEGAAFGLVYSGSDVGWTYTEK